MSMSTLLTRRSTACRSRSSLHRVLRIDIDQRRLVVRAAKADVGQCRAASCLRTGAAGALQDVVDACRLQCRDDAETVRHAHQTAIDEVATRRGDLIGIEVVHKT
jgi:hypothetical protein